MVLIKSNIDTDALRQDLEELEDVHANQVAPVEEKIREKVGKGEEPIDLLTNPPLDTELNPLDAYASAVAEQPFTKWLATQYGDELEVMKKIGSMKGINLSQAQSHIPKFPTPPIVGEKFIPDLVKEMRTMRRSLKGEHRNKITKAIDHLITAYEDYIQKCTDSIYWVRPYQDIIKSLALTEEKLLKLYNIKDGDTRSEFVEILCKMWEDTLDQKELSYGADFANVTKSIKDNRKLFNKKLKDISHQSIRKSKKEKIQENVNSIICNNPGITANGIHNRLPKSQHKITSPQSISKMVKKLNATRVDDGYYLLPNIIKKDLYSYVAGFIDSDGYITMDSKTSPRVGMIATGDRGRGFFKELEKELKCGRLHLDQKVGENSRSQHRLNFYSQNDIGVILEKCLPHFRMKKAQAELVLEAIRIKQDFKKQEWAKPRLDEIFKLIKYENWKDARNQTEFEKYGIDPEVVVKYHDNCKMSLMDELESGVV
tara:strand:- start:8821 stop:10275 length:1455 start_codon:yes stop_codon:yes gene_type:complete